MKIYLKRLTSPLLYLTFNSRIPCSCSKTYLLEDVIIFIDAAATAIMFGSVSFHCGGSVHFVGCGWYSDEDDQPYRLPINHTHD